MNRYYIVLTAIALVVGATGYIASDNLFIAIGTLAIFLAVSILLLVPKLQKHDKVVTRFHECYHFISNFIIALSIKKTVGLSLESTVYSMSAEFQEMFSSLQDMNDDEKLKQLNSNYFPFYLYQLFLQIISLYQEQGGNILEMSKYLLSDLRYSEEYVTKVQGLARRKYVEIGVLWLICLAILLFMRFSLKDFYPNLKGQPVFTISIVIFLLFVLASLYVLVCKGTHIKLKGYNPNEKLV